MKKLNVKPLLPLLGLALLSLVPSMALAHPGLKPVLLASGALPPSQAVLDSLTGEYLTQAMQKNQNTGTVLQWDDLMGLLNPVASGLTLKAAGSQVLGIDHGNRETYLGSLNAGYMQSGLRLQLGLHFHNTFFHDAISTGTVPKESTQMTGSAFTVGLAYPIQGVLVSAQYTQLSATGKVRGVDSVYRNSSQIFYNLVRVDLDQKNQRFNLAFSKNFVLSFSQVLTPYFAYQLERNQMGEINKMRIYNTSGIYPVTFDMKEQHVDSHSAMLGLLYQASDAFATEGLALGIDYTIAYRFGSKPKYHYTATLDGVNPGTLVQKEGDFKNPDSGVMQRFGFQMGYQWGAVYVGAKLNAYYTLTPEDQPGVLNTQYSLQLSGSF